MTRDWLTRIANNKSIQKIHNNIKRNKIYSKYLKISLFFSIKKEAVCFGIENGNITGGLPVFLTDWGFCPCLLALVECIPLASCWRVKRTLSFSFANNKQQQLQQKKKRGLRKQPKSRVNDLADIPDYSIHSLVI